MAMNRIQFQPGLSLQQFYKLFGTEALCSAALEKACCPGCGGAAHCILHTFVAAVSLTDEAHPLRVKLSPVPGFKLKAIADWASKCLAPGSTVYSDGLACFNAVTQAGCAHECTVVAGRKPKDVAELQWINTVLGNLKTSLSGSYQSFGFRKYAAQYLGAFAYRFNRRFDLKSLAQRLLVAAAQCGPHSQGSIRVVAEVPC